MALESATFISGLNASNPVGATDPKSQGDDHLRLIKTTLLNTFPNITGAMTASHTELNNLDGVTGVTGSGDLVLSASPTVTGTLTADAITASGVITGDGSGLTALDATALTGEIADARLSDNVPLLDAVNTFLANQNLSSTDPRWTIIDSNATAGEQAYVLRTIDGDFKIYASATDSNDLTGADEIVSYDRSADTLKLSAGTVTDGNNDEVLTTAGSGISVSGNAVSVDATVVRTSGSQTIGGAKTFSSDITLSGTRAIDATTRLNLTGATVSVGESAGNLGFYGAAGNSKPTVTGARTENLGDNQALARLLTELANLGLIVDNTTAS